MEAKNVAIVTGGTGFIGSRLCRKLVEEGWEVHLIIRKNSNHSQISDVAKKVTLHEYEGHPEMLYDVMQKVKPDIVYHLAAMVITEYNPREIEPIIQSNIVFGTQLVDAMVRANCFHLITTGTISQHFEGKMYSPTCLYAATKQAFEDILQFYLETTPIKIINLKLSHVYGPRDPKAKLFSLLRGNAGDRKPLSMSPGEQYMDIVYVDDVVNAYCIAGELLIKNEKTKKEEYFITSNKSIKLKELVEIYEKVIGKKLNIEWGGRPYRFREALDAWKGGKQLPGWIPVIKLEEGIRKMEAVEENEYQN